MALYIAICFVALLHVGVGAPVLMTVIPANTVNGIAEELKVYEDISEPGNPIIYIGNTQHFEVTKNKGERNVPTNMSKLWGGHSQDDVINAQEDILGNEILAKNRDPRYNDTVDLLPPVLAGSLRCGDYSLNAQTFIGSRIAADKRSFDPTGNEHGLNTRQKFHFDQSRLSINNTYTSLLGGYLPAVRYYWPLTLANNLSDGYVEQIAFAVPNSTNETIVHVSAQQPIWIRYMNVSGDGKIRYTHYVDTFEQYPHYCSVPPPQGGGWGPNQLECNGTHAQDFYAALLNFARYWNQTWEEEQGMNVNVPNIDVDVSNFAKHSVVREMITRRDMYFGRYGAPPMYYAECCDGFQDVFVAGMATYLEYGLFPTARGVMDNYYTYMVKRGAIVMYRGPEMAQYARMLTLAAQYYRYTKDGALLVKHADKMIDILNMLLDRRRSAQKLPKSDPSYGMIRGEDESDELFDWNRTNTELPHFSFSLEAWRAFRDLGSVWIELGDLYNRTDLTDAGTVMVKEAPLIQADVATAMKRSFIPSPNTSNNVEYNNSGMTKVPISQTSDFSELRGGAGFAPSKSPDGTMDIRSGAPGDISQAVVSHRLDGGDLAAYSVSGVEFSFQYVTGYNAPQHGALDTLPRISLLLASSNETRNARFGNAIVLWTSPPLGNYSFDHFTGYSPPVIANLTGIDIPLNSRCLSFIVQFSNNKYNLQVKLSTLQLHIVWKAQSASQPLEHSTRGSVCSPAPQKAPCHPYVAGEPTCSDMDAAGPKVSGTTGPYNGRASEPWRSYSGMFWSGGLSKQEVTDIALFNQQGSQLAHLGIWSGGSGFKYQIMSFTEQGHGYGLLQHNLIEPFLLQFYSEMAHDCTRGTWTCYESRGLPNFIPAGGYTTPSQVIVPLHLKWMLVFSDPISNILYLNRGTPRDWLLPESSGIVVSGASIEGGRISSNTTSSLQSNGGLIIVSSITLTSQPPPRGQPMAKQSSPPQIVLTLRVPPSWTMESENVVVIVDGKRWSNYNGTEGTISLPMVNWESSSLQVSVSCPKMP
eukprot:m.63678 g.63678  ORF g.63678 m.63678 type:complete len:1036 (+) comp11594_c0_seq2:140-3247(+)